MSPHLHYQIARARQQEIANRATSSHRHRAARDTGNRRRNVKHRVIQAIATFGVLVGAGTAVTVSDAHSNQPPVRQRVIHVSAPQLAREIRTLEGQGYVATACTVSGTRMRNFETRQSVLVEWQAEARHLAR